MREQSALPGDGLLLAIAVRCYTNEGLAANPPLRSAGELRDAGNRCRSTAAATGTYPHARNRARHGTVAWLADVAVVDAQRASAKRTASRIIIPRYGSEASTPTRTSGNDS